MKNSDTNQRIKREAKLGFAVFLLLFGAFSYIAVDRIVSGFGYGREDFESVPLALVIPPEDLPNIRNPDYVLPTTQSRAIVRKDSAPSSSLARPQSSNGTKTRMDNSNSVEPIASEMTKPDNSTIALSSHQEEIKIDDPLELNVEIPAKKFSAAKSIQPNPAGNSLSASVPVESRNDFQPSFPRGPKANNSFESPTQSNKTTPAANSNATERDGTLPFQTTIPQFQERLPKPLNLPLPEPTATIQTPANSTATKPVITETKDIPKTDDELVTVSEQDTLWDLATRIYGDGRLFAAVHEANKGSLNGQGKLLVGTQLRFPAKSRLLSEFRALVPQDLLGDSADQSASDSRNRREYTTRNGDSLFSIAREELGQASRYIEILELNSAQLSSSTRHSEELAAGLKLALPAK